MLAPMLYQDGNTIKLQVFGADVHEHRDDTWGWPAYSRPRLLFERQLLFGPAATGPPEGGSGIGREGVRFVKAPERADGPLLRPAATAGKLGWAGVWLNVSGAGIRERL